MCSETSLARILRSRRDSIPFWHSRWDREQGIHPARSSPLGAEISGITERLPRRYVSYALSIRRNGVNPDFDGQRTAWNITRSGLTPIGKSMPPAPVAVIGSEADDLALAIALDRMYGAAIWVPAEWTQNPQIRWQVQECYRQLIYAAHSCDQPPVVTSISLSEQELKALVDASWPTPIRIPGIDGRELIDDVDPPDIVNAVDLDLQPPKHLACTDDYDLSFLSATRADGRGGFEFLQPVPGYTPTVEALRGPQRPFWIVDVEPYPQRTPSGRDLRTRALSAGDAPAVLRSGRDGISFIPMNMFYVAGGATLAQSVAKPRLRVLGLRGWIDALAAQNEPDTKVQLSTAGRRARILTKLWGSRSAVARDLHALNDFLRAFKPSGSSDAEAYPDKDGIRLTPGEGYLTFAAARRALPGLQAEEIRERLNQLLHLNVLQRGLIIPHRMRATRLLPNRASRRDQHMPPLWRPGSRHKRLAIRSSRT